MLIFAVITTKLIGAKEKKNTSLIIIRFTKSLSFPASRHQASSFHDAPTTR